MAVTEKKNPTTIVQLPRALSVVNQDCGFHSYAAIGDYIGVTATSLQDLAERLHEVSLGSV